MSISNRIRALFLPFTKIKLSGINWKRSILVILICSAVIWDIISNGSVQKRLVNIQRYGKAVIALIVGLGVLLMINKPGNSKTDMMKTASDIVSVMPASATTRLMKGGIGFASNAHKGLNVVNPWGAQHNSIGADNQGIAITKAPKIKARSVSEARKKAVAASQGWTCSACNETLSATYEVDHIIELQDGGDNEISNLTAMCRNCHGEKTLRERLSR